MKKLLISLTLFCAIPNIYSAEDFLDIVKASGKKPEIVFQEEVINGTIPTIVDFFAHWCPACRTVAPYFEKISKDPQYKNRVRFIKVNYDEFKDICKQQNVLNLPYFGLYKNGRKVHFFTGKKSESELRSVIQKQLL